MHFNSWITGSLSEGDAVDHSYGDVFAIQLAGDPLGHFRKDSHCLEIEGTVATLDDPKV